ncbi:ABC transporter permease [Lichenihabitans sp. Uapishka_5]|uniref:ABC transporter permease n=1 Tax=Lichenihabitans sp. Uapishka_5 TaxID=3037302 RepID=UPI0029E7E79A|nr:ABC transporter permease [Lichenihabitans sp. Uapishka_5]MDX7953769.1 ABC transporter permease [Lichenihabitans sp. Uapishka_5]
MAAVASAGFALVNAQFATSFNLYVILSSAALLSLIGFSQLTVLAVGEFSLAVGSIGSLVGVATGYLLVTRSVPLAPAIGFGLGLGLLCGVTNGALVAVSGVGGFVVTLATGGAFAGIALAVTETVPYTGLPNLLNDFGTGRLGPLPAVLAVSLGVALWLGVLYGWRRTGRTMLAFGGNPEAARLSGLSRRTTLLWAHGLSGLLAGAAGIVAMAQLHEANPNAGSGWLLQSFTIPIVGGTLLTGGEVSVVGILVASLILATISDGLILVNVDAICVTLVQGVLVFVVVSLGRSREGSFGRWLRNALPFMSASAMGSQP